MSDFVAFWLKIIYFSGVCAILANMDWRNATWLDYAVATVLAVLWPVSVPWALLRRARQNKEWPYDR